MGIRTIDTVDFDDLAPGDRFRVGPWQVERDELLELNRRWDPLPIHHDDGAARARGLAGLTAAGQYTLRIKQAMLNEAPRTDAVTGALVFDELGFPRPVYPGDDIRLESEVLETGPRAASPTSASSRSSSAR